MAITMSKAHFFQIPSNVKEFTPRIMGINARKAVLVILSLSVSTMLMRFSILLPAPIIIVSLLFILPPGRSESYASAFLNSALWRLGGPLSSVTETSVSEYKDTAVFSDGGRSGLCIEVEVGDFHTMKESRKRDFINGLVSSLTPMECNYTVLGIPEISDPRGFYSEDGGNLAGSYNRFVDYAFSRSHFYRTYLVLWRRRGRNAAASLQKVHEEVLTLMESLSTKGLECKLIGNEEEMRKVLRDLHHEAT